MSISRTSEAERPSSRYTRNKPLASDVDLNILARRTPGFTGADLQNVLNEAALLAARFGSKQIAMAHAEEAIERVIAGPQRKSSVVSDKEKDIVAYHESGHALVGKMLPGADPVHKVSIIPRGRAGGYTLQLPEEDRRLRTKSQMMNDVAMLLGGRVAEELVLGEPSTGAYTDLERATKIARAMVTEHGMSERLGPLTFGKGHPDQVFLGRDIARDRDYSEEVAAAIDQEVRRIVDECLEMARSILTEHRDKLELLATTLKERETLERDEIDRLLGARSWTTPSLIRNLKCRQRVSPVAEGLRSGLRTQVYPRLGPARRLPMTCGLR